MSFIAESAMLGLAGGIAGELIGIAVAAATGLTSRMMTVGIFIFSFRLGVHAFTAGLIAGVTIGVLGGLLPAWRAAGIGVNESLREA
jgi:ABC-type lipoprotein release transport system permease subunit